MALAKKFRDWKRNTVACDTRRILIVDNDPVRVSRLYGALSRNLIVEVAYDGLTALRKLDSQEYFAVITAAESMWINGIGLLRWLRYCRPSIHRVLMSEGPGAAFTDQGRPEVVQWFLPASDKDAVLKLVPFSIAG